MDDVETTWRSFDDKKRELVITSAMRFITFDPEADFRRFDDFAMAAMTSVMVRLFLLSELGMLKDLSGDVVKHSQDYKKKTQETSSKRLAQKGSHSSCCQR